MEPARISKVNLFVVELRSVHDFKRKRWKQCDNLQWIYPDFSTLIVRGVYQTFTIFCLTVTIVILLVHIYGVRFTGRHYTYVNQLVRISISYGEANE